MRKYVSDKITVNTINQFEKGQNYLIAAEMGSGKNTFIRKVLLPFSKENLQNVLILVNRKALKDQQYVYLNDYIEQARREFRQNLTLITYQQLERMNNDTKEALMKDFHYIICDEAHYWINDSKFNDKTNKSFTYINNYCIGVKILLTATPDSLEYLPFKNDIITLVKPDYSNNNVDSFWSFSNENTILPIIQSEVDKDNKVLVINSNKQSAFDITEKINGLCAYLSSDNKYKEDGKKVFEEIITTQKFNVNVLSTTTLIDNGVELRDTKLQKIVINGILALDSFIQSIGRIRENRIEVYYKKLSKNMLLARINGLNYQLEKLEEFKEIGEVDFIEKYGNECKKFDFIYPTVKIIDGQKRTTWELSVTDIARINYELDSFVLIYEKGLEHFIKRYFPNSAIYDLEELKKQEIIMLDIIDNYLEKKLFKEGQIALKNILTYKYNLRCGTNSKGKIGLKTINSFFEDNAIGYKIISKPGTKAEGRKAYWILEQINNS